MNQILIESFKSVLLALAQIFSIVIFAGFLVRKKVITQEQIGALSKTTVFIFLPALIFSNILKKFHPQEMTYWWIIPLSAVVITLLGIGLNSLFFMRQWKSKKNILPLGAFQNAGYLVLPLGQFLFPNRFDEFSLFVFLYILGYNPVLWSIGKVLITSNVDNSEKISWKSFLTPPLLTTITSILIVLIGIGKYVPQPVIQATGLLGNAAVPVATFILGATLGSIKFSKNFSLYEVISSLFTKYFFIPLIVVIVVYFINLNAKNPLLADFFVIEAAVAPATGLIMMLRAYGGNAQKIGTIMIISYVFSLLATPLWIAVWNIIK